MSVRQLSAYLHIPRRTVYWLIKQHKIPAFQIGVQLALRRPSHRPLVPAAREAEQLVGSQNRVIRSRPRRASASAQRWFTMLTTSDQPSSHQSRVGRLYALVRLQPQFKGNTILSLTGRLRHSFAADRLSHFLLPTRCGTFTLPCRVVAPLSVPTTERFWIV